MKSQILMGHLLVVLLLLAPSSFAQTALKTASFYNTFTADDYYGSGKDMSLKLSTMSDDGKIVAFYGTDSNGQNRKFFIHDFNSTTAPTAVTLPSYVGNFNTNTGLISNTDGSRIFFNATDTSVTYGHLFGMINGKTGAVTILLRTTSNDIDEPQDMGTNGVGDFLYFNERDDGYGKGDLYRLAAQAGSSPELVLQAGSIAHPSGGTVKFIDGFDISSDGQTIVLFGLGWDKTDGTSDRNDKEIFVKTSSGVENLTNNAQNGKEDLILSGDGSTIVYTEDNKWMVTHSTSALNTQQQIETDYRSCGDKPGITEDGSIIFARSTSAGTSSCHAYLIQTDGSSRLMIEPPQISILSTYDGLQFSSDGKRVFFKNRWHVYPNEWYDMTAGVFNDNIWTTKVPSIEQVSYPKDMYLKLDDNEQFEVQVLVNDPDEIISQDYAVKKYAIYPSGHILTGESTPITLTINSSCTTNNLYTATGRRGGAWPSKEPIMTERFCVKDSQDNVACMDTIIPTPFTIVPSVLFPLLLN